MKKCVLCNKPIKEYSKTGVCSNCQHKEIGFEKLIKLYDERYDELKREVDRLQKYNEKLFKIVERLKKKKC